MTDNGDFGELDFSGVSPEDFATIVKGLSKQELAELTADASLREQIIREIFSRMGRQFRPEVAGSLKALIRWKVTGASEVVYDVTIDEGTCSVHEGRTEGEPRVTLVMGDAEFLKLVSGNANPVTLFMTRKLKLAGDVGLATGMTRLFDIPKAA